LPSHSALRYGNYQVFNLQKNLIGNDKWKEKVQCKPKLCQTNERINSYSNEIG